MLYGIIWTEIFREWFFFLEGINRKNKEEENKETNM